jgi:hypothetical protein
MYSGTRVDLPLLKFGFMANLSNIYCEHPARARPTYWRSDCRAAISLQVQVPCSYH